MIFEQCQGHTRRHRSRSIIRHPDPNSGFLCPTLEEIEKCDLEPRCHTYTVRWSDWGPCIAHQNLTCGSGLRQRFSECLRSDGGVVSKEFCQQVNANRLRMISDRHNCVQHMNIRLRHLLPDIMSGARGLIV